MRKYRFLILAVVVGIFALVLSTTSFCKDYSRAMKIVLYEDTGVHLMAPISAIMEMAERNNIPSDWPCFVDEQSIADATNGLIGPLQDDPFRAGVLRYSLQPIITPPTNAIRHGLGGTSPVLFISPDGTTVEFMAIVAFDDGIYCYLTTLEFNNSKIWPRYRQINYQEDTKFILEWS